MAGTTRVPLGGVPKSNGNRIQRISRQSSFRAQSRAGSVAPSRAGSVAPSNTNNGPRAQSGAASPADGMHAIRSPGAGTKRKEREFDMDPAEETNIHVVVRCRGRNDREVRENSGVVVSAEGAKGNSVELSMGPNALSNKTYHFDRVFSPAADQAMIYDDVVAPILDEMLDGYNCTVFAYGQTGTGKTYTMSGDMTETLGLLSDSAGIIPRVLSSLFRKLEADGAENTVKCSFIELYNEELRDLLSAEENAKLKLFEDGQKKGHSATFISGMEESHIKNSAEGIKLLQEGSHKRQVAATKCNDLSSRSHTVFTVTSYIKRKSDAGEDFIVSGKLNLVDLAGSENIQRSGAENKRAAEAGLINKSLLTLGRVINALVDKSSHIPYRESKLTRLLQDSLGGRTKTCIIATVSPARSNLEETISTLDYAFRAKNIRNKPQVNQMISKKTLLREFTAEIEKLKSELIATRHRNGVYLKNEDYEEMTVESESRRILSEEQKAKIETMETNLRNKVQELFALTSNFATLKKDTEGVKHSLEETNEVLKQTELVLADTRKNLADETQLRKAHQATEEELSTKGTHLISTLDRTVQDVSGLHAKLKRKSDVQSLNRMNWYSSQMRVQEVTDLVDDRIKEFQEGQRKLVAELQERIAAFVRVETRITTAEQEQMSDMSKAFDDNQAEATRANMEDKAKMDEVLEEIKTLREDVRAKVGTGLQGLSVAAGRISKGILDEMEKFHSQLHGSYSSLGRDFKTIFDDLTKHIEAQKAEAESLRVQLLAATSSALASDERVSKELQICIQEEREKSAADRQALLEQITSLVTANGKAQDERLTTRVEAVCQDMSTERAKLTSARDYYMQAMNAWSEKEASLADEVSQSREAIKVKLKQDWTTVNEQNSVIQTTTKSVHEEMTRLVDAQLTDLPVQMASLDEFVTKARAHNATYHTTQAERLERMAAEMRGTYRRFQTSANKGKERLDSAVQGEMSGACAVIQEGLPQLDELVGAPLAGLREEVLGRPLTEYTATGETPPKTEYSYPRSLPRTRTGKEEAIPNETDKLEDIPDLLDSAQVSPSKGAVFADSPPPLAAEIASIPRPATADGGLREIAVNLATGPGARGVLAFGSSERGAAAGDALHAEPLSKSLMGPPPLKRHATEGNNAAAKHHGRGIRAGGPRLEGRENMLPLSASVGSGGRRLRSSPNNA